MISTSKLDKSKGQQVVTQVQFHDYVIINTKGKQFKVSVSENGMTMLTQDSNGNWIDDSPLTKQSQDWLSTQRAVQTNTKEIQEHSNKILSQITDQNKLNKTVQDLQSQIDTILATVNNLQLHFKILNAQSTDISNQLIQLSNSQTNVVLDVQTALQQEVQDVLELNTNQSVDQLNNQTNEEIAQVIEEPVQINDQMSQNVDSQSSPLVVNKTFQLKSLQNDTFIIQSKDNFVWERVPKVISCRHIRQFFDLQVSGLQEDGCLILNSDPKLKNKQTLFVIQAI